MIGRDAARLFVNACGGTSVYIPNKVHAEHWIVEVIGPELAAKLCSHFSAGGRGIRYEIPMTPRSSNFSEVLRLTREGLPARKIARELRITTRCVHRNRSLARQRGLAQ